MGDELRKLAEEVIEKHDSEAFYTFAPRGLTEYHALAANSAPALARAVLEMQAAFEEIRDLARTELPPDAFGMDMEQWKTHKLNKIAGMAQRALDATKEE